MEISGEILRISKEALFLVLILSAPSVLVAMIVGLMISLLQATTQVQEQTLTFVPKLVAVMLTLALTASLTMAELKNWSTKLFDKFPEYVEQPRGR